MENCDLFDLLGENRTVDDSINFSCHWMALIPSTGTGNKTVHDSCAVTALCKSERVGYAILVPVISCLGMVLSLFNLLILMTNFTESSYSYLAGLAVADWITLFFFAVNGIGRGYYPNDPGWRFFEVYAYFPIGSSASAASVFLTVTVTIERFLFIYRPVTSRTWCHQRIARRVVVGVFLFSFLINSPRFFALHVGEGGQLAFTAFGASLVYSYIIWIYFFAISLGGAFCLIVFNILLIVGIRRTSGRRRRMQSKNGTGKEGPTTGRKHRDESTLTVTLIVVVCVFLVGEMPSALTSRSMVVALLGQGDQSFLMKTDYRVAVLVSTILVVGQHSANFFIYCFCNKRFSDVVKELVSGFCRDRRHRQRADVAEDVSMRKLCTSDVIANGQLCLPVDESGRGSWNASAKLQDCIPNN